MRGASAGGDRWAVEAMPAGGGGRRRVLAAAAASPGLPLPDPALPVLGAARGAARGAADQTYSWEDATGNQLDVVRSRRFKPCSALGKKTWAVRADWQYQNISMCAY